MRSLLRSGSVVIYRSRLTCVYKNLLVEDFLLQNTPSDQLCLLFYRNDDSVVIGRNQSVFAEVNFDSQLRFKIARRFSGGGAVFHDLGNVNYSVIMPRRMLDRRWAAELVCSALVGRNPSIRVNARSDVCVGEKKCGGSAYRIIRDRAYHHGTFLLSSDLGKLHAALCSPITLVDRPAVLSVPAVVANFSPHLSANEFIERVAHQFKLRFGVQADSVVDVDEHRLEGLNTATVRDPSWVVHRGPPHSFTYNGNMYKYCDGRLQDGHGEQVDARQLFPKLFLAPSEGLAEQDQVFAEPKVPEEGV